DGRVGASLISTPGGTPMRTPANGLKLGPRAQMAVRAVARLVNPLILLVAGRRWMPILGILHHTGRRSGRAYATPLGMRPLADAFVMPRTFGGGAAWYRNVQSAGTGAVTYMGRRQKVDRPEVVDFATAAPAFPRYERLQFRHLGINEYLLLHAAPSDMPAVAPDQNSLIRR